MTEQQKRSARNKRYYASHRKAELKRGRKWRMENKEKLQSVQKKYYKEHKLEIRKKQAVYNALNKDKLVEYGKTHKTQKSDAHRKRKYGLTHDEYLKMVKSQRGKCACCKKSTKLVVDHCHKTKLVRGLLCSRCNKLLGFAIDNTRILKAAIAYLRRVKK